MGFCSYSREFSLASFTGIENQFINKYMPLADGDAVKAYVFGLYLCQNVQGDYSLEEAAKTLNMSAERLTELFRFWEDFDLDWLKGDVCPVDRIPQQGQIDVHGDYGRFCYVGYRHSLCHGWSAGVIPFLIGRILGVTPLEAGYRKVKIAPHLGGLTFAKADIPTPQGILHVSCRAGEDGKVHTTVTAPEGVQVVS